MQLHGDLTSFTEWISYIDSCFLNRLLVLFPLVMNEWRSMHACECVCVPMHHAPCTHTYTHARTHPRTHTHTHTHTDLREYVTNFRIAVVADQDKNSRSKDKLSWHSWLKTGTLTLHKDRTLSVKWDREMIKLETKMAEKGRGAELSDLCVFNGRLYTVCDRTGIGMWLGRCCWNHTGVWVNWGHMSWQRNLAESVKRCQASNRLSMCCL